MKRSFMKLTSVALFFFAAATSVYAQNATVSCDQMVDIGQRTLQLSGKGRTTPQIMNQLLPASPSVTDELFVMLTVSGVMMASVNSNDLNWDRFKSNCEAGKVEMTSIINTICSSLGDLTALGTQLRDSGEATEQEAVRLAMRGIMQGMGGADSDMGRMTNALLETIVSRELHSVYANPQKTGEQFRADLLQRCGYR